MKLLKEIQSFVVKEKLRLSMHPDRFTVLNSPKDEVVKKSIDFLQFHADFLNLIDGSDITIHIGGIYNEKNMALNRFISEHNRLNDIIKGYIRIENNKSYHIKDILKIHESTKFQTFSTSPS